MVTVESCAARTVNPAIGCGCARRAARRSYPTRKRKPFIAQLASVRRMDSMACCTSQTAISGRSKTRLRQQTQDRKSTRLNSSHPSISYAVFCLKKKKKKKQQTIQINTCEEN